MPDQLMTIEEFESLPYDRDSDVMTIDEFEQMTSHDIKIDNAEQRSIFGRFSEGIDFAVAQTPSVVGKFLFWAGDSIRSQQKTIFGTDPVFDTTTLGDRIANAGLRMFYRNQQAASEKFPAAAKGGKDFVRDLGSGTVSLATALGMGAIAGPAAAGVAFGASAGAEGFFEARTKGKDFEDAKNIAGMLGFVEGSLEFVGIDRLLHSSGGIIKRAVKGYITEATQEFSQSIASSTIKTASGIKEFEGRDTLIEILTNAVYEGVIGGVLGGVASVPISLSQRQAVEDGFRKMGMDKKTAQKAADNVMKQGLDDVMTAVEIEEADIEAEIAEISTQKEKADQESAVTEKLKQRITEASQRIKEISPTVEKVTDAKLQEEIKKQKAKEDEIEFLQIRLDITKEINDFLRKRINKQKNPDIAEEVAEIPKQFSTSDKHGLSADEALDEINNAGLGVQFENLREMTKFLQESIDAEQFLKEEIQLLKPKTVRKRETTVLKEKIQNIQRGFRIGATQARRDVKKIQDDIIGILNESDLSLNDKAKFIKTIKNIQTNEQFEKNIDEIVSRIDKLSQSSKARTLREQINKELKSTKVTKQAGKPKGKFTADIQNILDRAREITKMTRAEAQEQIAKNLEIAGDKIPTFEQAIENRLLGVMSGMENKSPSELESILNDIKTLKSQGFAESFLRDLDTRARNKKLIETALKVIKGDKPLPTDRFEGFRQKASKVLKTSYISLVGWGDKMDILSQDDRSSKQDQSELNKITRVSDEVTQEKLGVRQASEKVVKAGLEAYNVTSEKELFRQLSRDAHPVDLGTYTDGFGERVQMKFTKAELRKRWMEFQDLSLLETFTTAEIGEDGKKHGMGYTQEMIDAIEANLTQEDIDFAKAQLEFYRDYYNGVNEIYREIYGVDLPFNEFYSPIKRKFTQGSVADEFLKEISFRQSVATGSLKSRVENIRPIKEQSDIDTLLKHIVEMEHFKNWVFKIRDLNAIFGNTEIRDAIEKKFGQRMLRTIDDHIQDFTRGGINRANNVTSMERLRRNFTISALALKPALTVKQMVSFVAYAETIPSNEFAAGVADFLSNPVAKTKILAESELLKARGRDLNRDIKDVSSSETYALLRKNPTFINSLMINVRLGDKGAILLGGWSIYRYHRKIGKTHEQAIREFERVTAATQQSGDIDQLSDWQRGGSFQKLFTMFTSSQNQYFRREVGAIRNAIKGRIGMDDLAKKIAVYHFILPMLFQWVVNFGRWDTKDQVRAAILGSLNGLFWLGDIIESAILAFQGERVFPSETPLQTLEKGLLKSIPEITSGDIDEGIKDLLEDTLGPISGLPIKTLLNAHEGVMDVMEGEAGKGALKMMGWSPYVVEKNLKEDKKWRRTPLF